MELAEPLRPVLALLRATYPGTTGPGSAPPWTPTAGPARWSVLFAVDRGGERFQQVGA